MAMIRWVGGLVKYEQSYNGTAVLRLSKCRTTRTGKQIYVQEEIGITRSNIKCLYNALKEFADAERKAIGELPL